MSFVTITTWRMTTETESLQHVKELMSRKYFPGLLALGAKHSMLMDAGLDRFAIVTIYPSQEVRDDAIAHISALRGEGAEEFGAELMDTYAGALLAASDDEPVTTARGPVGRFFLSRVLSKRTAPKPMKFYLV